MRYRRLQTLGFAVLLATLTAIHCIPTETQADRRRSTTFLAASSQDSWPEWDGVTAYPELTDAHPTTGWPREYGRICVTFTAGPSGEHRAIIDGRTDGEDPRPYLSVVNDGRIRFGIQTVGSIAGGEVIPFHTHTACVDRSYGPRTSLYLDGQLIGTSTTLPAWDWHPTARLGSRYGGADPLGGEIKSIQWRGFRLACDMRSGTCSDGRQITTVRATPVPCETSPGVWEMVPAGQGCYSVRGLESWAANTSYVSYGSELDREPWGPTQSGVDIQPIGGGAVRVCTTVNNTGIRQYLENLTEPGIATGSIIARVAPPNTSALIGVFQGVWGIIAHPGPVGSWAQMSFTGEGEVGVRQQLIVYPRPYFADLINCIDIMAAWRTKTATPGRPCWGGEAPVTCAADRHTISTEGWPTESGEISLVYTPQDVGIGTAMHLVTTTSSSANQPSGFYLYRISETGSLVFGMRRGDTVHGQNTQVLAWENGRSYHIRVRWSPERAEIWRDGVLLRSWVPTVVPDSHPDVAYIGINVFGGNPAQGSIRSLTIRSYEEVSP